MATPFDKYAAKGNELLHLLAEDLQISNEKAFRILKAVLHVLRDHVSIQASVQLMAQLPVAVKGVYVEQWHVNAAVKKLHVPLDFFNEVCLYDKSMALQDFENYAAVENSVKAVFRTLNYYLSNGAFEDIIAVMPTEIKKLIENSIGKNRMVL
ncbi:DUF2267 domain-containing protein [Parafilimonas sp.]|uniref:DUF2267 domain-containing protein n=1 Tax=Parafilimonas sp. TaxID=1969739 RepID=UPI003F816114